MSKKTASVIWNGEGMSFTGVGGSGFSLQFNNPSGPGAASPMELVAIASGTCTAMDVIDILRKKRQAVSGFEVKVIGLRTSGYPSVFTEIDLEYVVRGRNIDPKAVERSIELSLAKYCSVNTMLKNSGAVINSRYRIEEAETVAA
ncbi:MAG: OsmC family protein [Chloroflexi bacterium]|nr:OsmC family protein [Chloroflexota bacterium]